MVWKKVNNSDAGDSTHYGGNDIDKFSDLFSGVSNVDTVDINSNTTFRDQKFRARNPLNSASYIFGTSGITANRQATLPLLNADDTFVFANASQTIANKIINGSTVDFSSTALPGLAGDPSGNKWGSYQPIGGTTNATVGVLDGFLSGHIPSGLGTASNSWDTTEGFLINHTTAASSGSIAGLTPPTTIGQFRRARTATARVRWQASSTTSTRLYMGFSSNSTLPISDSPIGTAEHGIILGFSTVDTNFTATGNDGSGTAGTYNLGIAKNANFNTMEINWPASGNANVVLNGTTTTISTVGDLPAATTNLFFHAQIQTASATARTISMKGLWMEST